MGCCGDEKQDAPASAQNRPSQPANGKPVATQPAPTPQMNHSNGHAPPQSLPPPAPGVVRPAPVYGGQQGGNPNGGAEIDRWRHSVSPTTNNSTSMWGSQQPPRGYSPSTTPSNSAWMPHGARASMYQAPSPEFLQMQQQSSFVGHVQPMYHQNGGVQPNGGHQTIVPPPIAAHHPGGMQPQDGSQGFIPRLPGLEQSDLDVAAETMPMDGAADDEGKLSVGIDFGTTFSGVAYASKRFQGGQVQQILVWPGSYETYRKTPTCLLYAQNGPNEEAEEARVVAWGLEAKNRAPGPGLIKCEWFKLFLTPEALHNNRPDPRLPALPYGKSPEDVVVDFLTCLWSYAKEKISDELGSVADLESADVVLTVPSAWDAKGCSVMRAAAIRARLVRSARADDRSWQDRLRIITEPEAAAIHASTLSTLHNLRPPQTFIICDAGGGTVDTAAYKLMGQLSRLEIAEMAARSGRNCGSLFIDLRFQHLVRSLLKDHPIHLEPASMAAFMHAFSNTDKLAFHGTPEDDESIFRFNCFNLEDSHDLSVGLENGELCIPGRVLKRDVFDPIVAEVLDLIDEQIRKCNNASIDALILVGGFSASEYLFTRVREQYGHRIAVIARPNDCDVATLQGASRYGLGLSAGKVAVASVISPRSYIMRVRLPAEPIDIQNRPAYITNNNAGIQVCENRLSYLVAAGAILKKGQILRSRFCKYSKGPQDHFFTAVLYVSESAQINRWTDEGETRELCRWTVDLSALPNFHAAVARGPSYLEFDLGLILDSAEVRGILLSEDGRECGAASFEYLK